MSTPSVNPGNVLARLEQTASQLFFIVGCGRSGTSLLQAMVAAHPDAAIPPETGFYTIIRKRTSSKFRDLRKPGRFERAIELTLQFWRIEAMNLDRDAVRELCHAGERSWRTILLALLTLYAEQENAARVGEKSPGNLRYMPLIAEEYPLARFIHIVRDPRAVILSLNRAPFGIPWTAHNIGAWKRAAVMHARVANQLGPSRYLLVRYEDLVQEQEATLRSVCSFLDLTFHQDMLQHHAKGKRVFAERQMAHMANTLSPVFTSSIDKWRHELTSAQIALIEYELGDAMEGFGYDAVGARTTAPSLKLAAGRALAQVSKVKRRLVGKRKADPAT